MDVIDNSTSKIIQGVKKIAVLRANALGDFIFALPALHALRKTYPESEIVYLGNLWHQVFLANRPGPVDRVIIIPSYNGIPNETDRIINQDEVDVFFQKMVNEKFDIAIQMHGGGKNSNPFILNLGARITLGLRTPDAVHLDINLFYHLYHPEVLRYLELVSLIGARTEMIEPSITLIPSDRKEVLEKIGLLKPYVVIHPGASDLKRRWSVKKFALVGEVLIKKGIQVLVTGIESEKKIVDELILEMNHQARNMCGKLSIGGLAYLLSNAEIVISNDSGPLHLARAVNTKTVGIYWCANIITAGPLTSGKHRTSVSWVTKCPLCGLDCLKENIHLPNNSCDHNTSFIDEIESGEVIDHALALLSQHG